MDIEQIKKEFETKIRQGKFTNKLGGMSRIRVWQFIEQALKEAYEKGKQEGERVGQTAAAIYGSEVRPI